MPQQTCKFRDVVEGLYFINNTSAIAAVSREEYDRWPPATEDSIHYKHYYFNGFHVWIVIKGDGIGIYTEADTGNKTTYHYATYTPVPAEAFRAWMATHLYIERQ